MLTLEAFEMWKKKDPEEEGKGRTEKIKTEKISNNFNQFPVFLFFFKALLFAVRDSSSLD